MANQELKCGTKSLWGGLTLFSLVMVVVGASLFGVALSGDPGVSGIATCDINIDCYSDNIPRLGT
jgi:hypothetical protein